MANTAQYLHGAFFTAQNGNVCINQHHTAADIVRDMVYEANEFGLGGDFAYEAVRDALAFIHDTMTDPTEEDLADAASEFADISTAVYTYGLVEWLASAPARHVALCDEAREHFGIAEAPHVEEIIRQGQYYAYTSAMQAVRNNWPTE